MRTKRRSMMVFTVVVGLAGACGDDSSTATKGGGDSGSGASSGSFAGSCQNSSSGFCNEFTGSGYTAATVEQDCKRQGNGIVYLPGHCPSADLVGTCIVYKGKASESYYKYYATFPGTPSATADSARTAGEKQCTTTLKGEWSTP